MKTKKLSPRCVRESTCWVMAGPAITDVDPVVLNASDAALRGAIKARSVQVGDSRATNPGGGGRRRRRRRAAVIVLQGRRGQLALSLLESFHPSDRQRAVALLRRQAALETWGRVLSTHRLFTSPAIPSCSWTFSGSDRTACIQSPNAFISSLPIPREVMAGVPIRMPLGSKGLRGSKGTLLALHTMPAVSKAFAATFPGHSER